MFHEGIKAYFIFNYPLEEDFFCFYQFEEKYYSPQFNLRGLFPLREGIEKIKECVTKE
jgi:hypothetical protein